VSAGADGDVLNTTGRTGASCLAAEQGLPVSGAADQEPLTPLQSRLPTRQRMVEGQRDGLPAAGAKSATMAVTSLACATDHLQRRDHLTALMLSYAPIVAGEMT
jgi:hypothetical protein